MKAETGNMFYLQIDGMSLCKYLEVTEIGLLLLDHNLPKCDGYRAKSNAEGAARIINQYKIVDNCVVVEGDCPDKWEEGLNVYDVYSDEEEM